MSEPPSPHDDGNPRLREHVALEIRVRGRVQGVGFRPHVYRIARELGIRGEVLNDPEGVLIRGAGDAVAMEVFLRRVEFQPPRLARVETIERRALDHTVTTEFRIVESVGGAPRTEVAPDAAVCEACSAEVLSPLERRYRYPFATCTDCGPRLSIVLGIPYDRRETTMSGFRLCSECRREYEDPADRRFHAEPIACHACGPRVRIERMDGGAFDFEQASTLDAVETARGLLLKGEIVAIKGIGAYHVACDATKVDVVARLRERKARDAKPFALMARDLDVVRRYCEVSPEEARVLTSPAAPIVLLDRRSDACLPEAVAPGHHTLGFMLPTTPLHLLVMRHMDRPVIMTSGNVADLPPVIDDDVARTRLAQVCDYLLVHDRPIANRVDDSVARVVDGAVRVMRRARGHAPAPLRLPRGFEVAPALLAVGAELKSTFCVLRAGEAILSQHQGDLGDVDTFEAYTKNIELYAKLFQHAPTAVVADMHPDYVSSRFAREHAAARDIPFLEVQHHHAHVASCLAQNGRAIDAAPVLGLVLDGLGLGEERELWGGEFLLSDYVTSKRLGTFKPVALIGGDLASREPWRALYAHLMAEMGWVAFASDYAELEVFRQLSEKPRALLDQMLARGIQSPRASSCGRLFDAVAAAVGICFDKQSYEGQAATLLEAAVNEDAMNEAEALAYPFALPPLDGKGLPYVEPLAMWRALLGDLALETPPGTIAARFHRGLARAIAAMAVKLRGSHDGPAFDTVALSGGCFQNRVLFRETTRRLETAGFRVLTHAEVPPNDGGISLGQAVTAAARLIAQTKKEGH